MIEIAARNIADAAPQVAARLLSGHRKDLHGERVAYLNEPVVVSLANPVETCPRFVALGNPYSHLLTSFASLFPLPDGSRFPESLRPQACLTGEASPSAFAGSVVADGRAVVFAGAALAGFEAVGTPDNMGVLSLNVVSPTGSVMNALAPGCIRWGMLQQAIASLSGFMLGGFRLIVLHPIAAVEHCEAILQEVEAMCSGPLYADGEVALGVASAPGGEWLTEAAMFLGEHAYASGYQHRPIRSLLVPAVAAWMKLTDADIADRRSAALEQLATVKDQAWRRCLERWTSAATVELS